MKRIRLVTLVLLGAFILAACQQPGANTYPEAPNQWDAAAWDTATWE